MIGDPIAHGDADLSDAPIADPDTVSLRPHFGRNVQLSQDAKDHIVEPVQILLQIDF